MRKGKIFTIGFSVSVLPLLPMPQSLAAPLECPKAESMKVLKNRDLILNPATAIKFAEVILTSVYGEQVLKERPFKVTSSGDFWAIEGSMPGAPKGQIMFGGVALMLIRKSDAKVLTITHGK